MRKGDQTRTAILQKAVELFNVQGFQGASLSDIMEATGLQKGGIYNHFENKEILALEAFDYGFRLASERMMYLLKDRKGYLSRLIGIVEFFEDYFESPPVHGGCVILNTAVESDDTNPALRARVQDALNQWRKLIERTVIKGINAREIRPETDPDALATVIIATVEGALMMSKVYDDTIHMRRAVEHLKQHIQAFVATQG
jgi:TetR/AcrR family transcriptional regulator, transcriptional repressor for nem operon